MADPQQVLYGDDGKAIPSTALYDDNGKPISAQQGQSHGWLLDNLWNAGERAIDIGKGILNASPMGQMSQASDALTKLQQNPHAFDPQLESFRQQLGNVTVPQYASALAMNADPTGMVPGEVGLAKQIPSDIANRNVGGAAVNAGLMTLPMLEPFLGGKTPTNAPISEIAPKEAPISTATELPARTLPVEQPNAQPTLFDDTGKRITKEPATLEEAQNQGEQLPINSNHTPTAISAKLDSHPDIASGAIIKPPPDVVNSTPVEPVVPSDNVIPRAGNALPTPDVGPMKAEFNGPNLELKKYSDTSTIANSIEEGQLQRDAFLNRTLNQGTPLIDGLNEQQRITVGKIVSAADYDKDPTQIPGATPDLLNRAAQYKQIMDEVHPLLTPDEGEETVGKIDNYLSMIKKDKTNPLYNYFWPKIGDTISGDVGSRFAETREGLIPEEDREFDIGKVFPMYVASAARDAFMKPAIADSFDMLAKVPTDTNRYELAKSFINNASGYDNEPNLQRWWNQTANNLANSYARSYAGLNIPLHILHAAKIPATMWPELGTGYTAQGLFKTLTDPINSWNEVTRNGLIKGNIVPSEFRTGAQRIQNIMNFFNGAEGLASSTGYFGAKAKIAAENPSMAPNDVTMNAIKLARVMNLTSDAGSTPKFMTPESNWIGGAGGSKVVNQFKGPPLQLANFYYNKLADWRSNKPAAARTLAAMGVLGYLGENHIGNLSRDTIGLYTHANQIAHDLFAKGDIGKAVMDTLKFIIPGAAGLGATAREF